MKLSLCSFILLIVPLTKNLACSCTGLPELSNHEMNLEWYNEHEFVFTAVVDSVQTINDEINYEFFQHGFLSVKTVYKGSVPGHLKITPPHFHSSCEFDLREHKGELMLFYAYTDGDGNINSHFCDGTKNLLTTRQIDTLSFMDYYKKALKWELSFLKKVARQKKDKARMRYSNHVLQANGRYENGLPDGNWKYFNYFGRLTSLGTYKKGIKEGAWMHYTYYLDSKKEGGKYKYTLVDGGFDTGQYKEGKKNGEWKHFDSTGIYSYSSWYEDGLWVEKKVE